MTEKDLAKYFTGFEKEVLSEIHEAAEIKTAHEDEVIGRSGQNIRAAILVIDGLVKIYREDEQSGQYFMHYLDEGEAGAISLGGPYAKG